MSIKLTMFAILIGFQTIPMKAQDDEAYTAEDTVCVITNEHYNNNPARYLQYIDSSKIPTGILIDRVKFRKDIGDFDGKSRVKTCDYSIWKRLYNNCKFASNDSSLFQNAKEMRLKAVSMVTSENNMVPIGLINLKYNKLKLNALTDGRVSENDSSLDVLDLSYDILKQKRLFAATTFENQIYGDEINFFISPDFYITNDTIKITKIEIDFGNGEGYKQFYWNKIQIIKFNEASGYKLGKIRLSYATPDSTGIIIKKLISHFTFLRTGNDLIPEVKEKSISNLKSGSITVPNVRFTYPAGSTKDIWVLKKGVFGCSYCTTHACHTENETCYGYIIDYTDETTSYNYVGAHTKWVRTYGNYKIDASILWGYQNSSGKLRNPIIIPDAIDPGSSRDYYTDHITYDGDPRKFDNRGLYQIIDGQPSGWYPGEANSGTVSALINAGYDLVFLNFANGTGDIEETADTLTGFLNTFINSSNYRDENTGEIILIGPSMAGMVTRLALTKMEQSGQEHFVKTWVAFDSPQKGAYIPIALQWGIYYLSKRPDDDIGSDGMATLQGKLATLNTPAAREMLLQHYTALGSETEAKQWYGGQNEFMIAPINDFSQLHDRLDELGYPRLTRNLAITNGGTSKLYETAGKQIVKFNNKAYGLDHGFDGYGQNNDIAQHKFFQGFWHDGSDLNDYALYSSYQTGFENAPGGWHSDLYNMNQDEGNGSYALDYTSFANGRIEFHKACFMVTASAFGLPITRDNVYKTWTQFSANQTPFDDILGITGINEEHMKISPATKNNIITFLNKDDKILQRPRPHLNGTITETVSEPLLLQSDSVAILGSANGQAGYVIKSEAKVKLYAPNKIKLLPGTKCERGATFKAKVQAAGSKKDAFMPKPAKGIDYSIPSPWTGKIYSYTEDNFITLIKRNIRANSIHISPNPTNGIVNVEFMGTVPENTSIDLYNQYGQKVHSIYITEPASTILNLTALPAGIYIIKTSYGGLQKVQKLIKQ